MVKHPSDIEHLIVQAASRLPIQFIITASDGKIVYANDYARHAIVAFLGSYVIDISTWQQINKTSTTLWQNIKTTALTGAPYTTIDWVTDGESKRHFKVKTILEPLRDDNDSITHVAITFVEQIDDAPPLVGLQKVLRNRLFIAAAASVVGGFSWLVIRPVVEHSIAELQEWMFPTRVAVEVYNVNIVSKELRVGEPFILNYTLRVSSPDCVADVEYFGTDKRGVTSKLPTLGRHLVVADPFQWRVTITMPDNIAPGSFTLSGQVVFSSRDGACNLVLDSGPYYFIVQK